ncbi:hypothetical protein M0811_12897 [Anaeramoeba ignava]|uniref:Regulator of chromosome condensation n=1 Tax=Anaeramoeba ignava TaxID=1746090 RepID=A0A9Q0L6V0_ANAIG|nr:hypothetical protein M0811_12897 [Anaeramoeba ignava]
MDEILYFGKNEFPKLFVNEPYQITRPIKFNFPNLNLIENENENEIKRIKQISANQTTTIFLFQNGKAIKYTENDSNQNPEKIQIENIEKVTLGSDNEAVLTSKGKVFAKGKYINRKNPNEFIKISSLIEDPNDRIIEDVVSGAESIFLLTSNQNVYGIGLNSHAQFGFEDPKTAKKPIFMMSNITRVFTNTFSYSVFLLDSNEELFSCGNNLFGQLGLIESRNEPTSIINFTQIKNLPKGKIIDIQMGNLHSLMLIEDEDENQNPKTKLYSCGFNEFNGLGRYQVTYKFTEIKSPLFENDNIREFFEMEIEKSNLFQFKLNFLN